MWMYVLSVFSFLFLWLSEGKSRRRAENGSEDSGDDLDGQIRSDALDSFAVDIRASLAGASGVKKKGGGKKGRGKGKK